MSCLQEKLADALKILSEMLRQPRFDSGKLDEIKSQFKSSIARRNDNPQSIIFREFEKIIYADRSPFSQVMEYQDVENITISKIKKTYERFFYPKNVLLGAVGNINLKELIQLIEKYLGDWNRPESEIIFPQAEENQSKQRIFYAQKDNLNQSYIAIGHLGTTADIKERAAIMVFNNIFSQGMDSRLFSRIRTKLGLTYGVGGGIGVDYLYPGLTYFYTFTKMETTAQAIDAFFEELELIRKEKVSAEELNNTLEYQKNSFVFRFSSPDKILNNELISQFYGLPDRYQFKLLEAIKNVTADDVLQIAQKLLNPEKMKIFVLGKEKELIDQLKKYGEPQKIDITTPAPKIKSEFPQPTAETLKKGKDLISSALQKNYRNYKNLKTISFQSEMIVKQGQMSLKFQGKTMLIYPDKLYSEQQIMGQTLKMVINGNRGYMEISGNKQPLDSERIKSAFKDEIYRICQNEEMSAQLLPEEMINNTKYLPVLIRFASDEDNWIKLFYNPKSGFFEIIEKVGDIMGQKDLTRRYLKEIKMINGIPVAFLEETFVKDQKVIESKSLQVKVNEPIDSTLFEIKD